MPTNKHGLTTYNFLELTLILLPSINGLSERP
jgi:hypothetical protein